jgi:IS5 family transposase
MRVGDKLRCALGCFECGEHARQGRAVALREASSPVRRTCPRAGEAQRRVTAPGSRTGLVHSASVTAGNVHDSQELPNLLSGEETRLYGDSAYRGKKQRQRSVGLSLCCCLRWA